MVRPYVVGTVVSSDFPVTSDAFQTVNNEIDNPSADYYSGNMFVTQLNANGSGLIYSSYLGGSGGDVGSAIALDAFANVYITGNTISHDFPVSVGAYQAVNRAYSAGNPQSKNAFIAKFEVP